jgi:phosphopantothenoylcysteine decarboxylase/phosphopantothenate--cysteine ligase
MSKILFVLTGSIACYKACDAISRLVQAGHSVRSVATAAALRFVGTPTLEALTRERVATALFDEGHALEHVELARWPDLVVVCPATANTLNRMAAGLADDLAGALLLACDPATPLLIAPAMNPAMWQHAATRAAVETLRLRGARFIAPGEGRTACGEIGEGRLAEPAEIVAGIEAALRPERRLRVLITSGGTVEPIDGVRVIANTSTGATGALLANTFLRCGHDVLLLRATGAVRAGGARDVEFRTFPDLDAALERLLAAENFDAVIHAAAVSDFSLAAIEIDGQRIPPGTRKLGSDRAPVLHLKRNPKLLETLRARSRNPAVRVVGFKLTQGANEAETRAAVAALGASGAVDFVVHNDLAHDAGAGAFPASIWSADGRVLESCATRGALAAALLQVLSSAHAPGERQISHAPVS